MAENKKSFLLYCDIIHCIDHLTDEEKGKLFQHLLEYVNDMSPVLEDRLLITAWKPIERQLKRDLRKYEKSVEEKSHSGRLGNLKRWNPDLYDMVILEKIVLDEAENIAKHRKTSQSDNFIANIAVNDTVNDTVNVNDTISTKVDSDKGLKNKEKENNINGAVYSKSNFIDNWNTMRNHYLKTPSNFNRMGFSEETILKELINKYNKEEFQLALKGLFKQESMPKEIMWLNPKHLLNNFETYLDAEMNKKYKLYT